MPEDKSKTLAQLCSEHLPEDSYDEKFNSLDHERRLDPGIYGIEGKMKNGILTDYLTYNLITPRIKELFGDMHIYTLDKTLIKVHLALTSEIERDQAYFVGITIHPENPS